MLRVFHPAGFCAITVAVLLFAATTAARPLPMPDPVNDAAFLYGDWQATRPSVVVFMDPLCPYCKRAAGKLGLIVDFNVFVYWAPVFGERSESAVAPFFRCARPSSAQLLATLIEATDESENLFDDCVPNTDPELRQRNDNMVAAYPVNGVPTFFLQGIEISLDSILARQRSSASRVNGVALDWRRYEASRIAELAEAASMALIVRGVFDTALLDRLQRQYQPAYLFVEAGQGGHCSAAASLECAADPGSARLRQAQLQELSALLDLAGPLPGVYVIERDGRLSELPTVSAGLAAGI